MNSPFNRHNSLLHAFILEEECYSFVFIHSYVYTFRSSLSYWLRCE